MRVAYMLLVMAVAMPAPGQAPNDATGRPAAVVPAPAWLQQMPANVDRRCVGIALVTDALFEGQVNDHLAPIEHEVLATHIYDMVYSNEPLEYPAKTLVDGKPIATLSKTVLERLTGDVAARYRRDFIRTIATPRGCQGLQDAMGSPVASRATLHTILDADEDGIEVFCGAGIRFFPDGTQKDTQHAFLIRRLSNTAVVVYDPNDLSAPVEASISERPGGLHLSWSCTYRDQSIETMQRYVVIPQQWYFSAFDASVAARTKGRRGGAESGDFLALMGETASMRLLAEQRIH